MKLWFRAKRYGWGWTPCTWQGWLLIVAYVAAIVWIVNSVDGTAHSGSDALIGAFLPIALLTGGLIWICILTGEKPRWRWGGKD